MKAQTTSTLASRLDKHPSLKARAENTHGNWVSANEAEQRALEQVRQLGNEEAEKENKSLSYKIYVFRTVYGILVINGLFGDIARTQALLLPPFK